MSRVSIERAIPAGDRILLDTSTLIAYLDGSERVNPVATYVMDGFVRTGRNEATISMVTVMELMVRPLRAGVGEQFTHVMDLISRFPHLRALNIDLFIAQEAATIRAVARLKAPDTLNVATGVLAQVDHLITNDGKWRARLAPLAIRIQVCYLEDHLPFP